MLATLTSKKAWRLAAVVSILGGRAALAQCPEDHLLTASHAVSGDELGSAVAIDGEWAAVGAWGKDTARGSGAGAVSLFRFNATTHAWEELQVIEASDGGVNDHFGSALALSSDWLAVGAATHDHNGVVDCGAVYLFQNVNGTWVEKEELTASDAANGDQYGTTVSLSSRNLAVGAWLDDNPLGADAGAVYVYEYSVVFGWGNEQKLVAGDGAYEDKFGISVMVDDAVLVVGAFHDDDPAAGYDAGSAYIFCKSSGLWTECSAKLIASDRALNDEFGVAVAIHDHVIAVGATSRDDPSAGVDAGAVYVFRRIGASWFEEQIVMPATAAAFDRFGASVVVGDKVVVGGAPGDDHPSRDMGSAYAFRQVGAVGGACGWVEDHWLAEKNATQDDLFGNAIAMSANTALIGNRRDDANGIQDSGSAALFDVSELSLAIDPTCAVAGQTITFKTCCGNPGEPVMLAVVAPTFAPVVLGVFAADCRWHLSATVPPGLDGVTVTFAAFEVVECTAQAVASNPVTVAFKATCP